MRHRLRNRPDQGFALAITLILLALIIVIVVAYLASTRTERASASVYANRQRAKITADSALASAIHLLYQNTKYGNYITAMPAPSPSPTSIYTELYRPADPLDQTHAARPNDFVQLSNAVGEILVSRAVAGGGGSASQIDPRPSPDPVPTPLAANASFALPSPIPALLEEQLPPQVPKPVGNSYNFNQVVRVGTNNSGRLVQPSPTPSPPPALGQWINVRNPAGDLIGRYAFFIEDESMKINVNVAGNTAASRPTDLTFPPPATPATQVEEIDPSGILATANRGGAESQLAGLGASGNRIPSRSTVGLLAPQWSTTLPDYAHMATVFSRDDATTARGWQRLDLNTLVAGAKSNADKVALAKKLSNWIKDAWTGPTPISALQTFQIFGDERLRLQLAANIIDYIDADSLPTDLGDYPDIGQPPDPTKNGYPVIGIERIPYLTELDVTYKSAVTNPGAPGVENSGQATIGVSFRVNFENLFERDLQLEKFVAKILIRGIPAIDKENGVVFDHQADWYEIPVGSSDANPPVNVAKSTAPIVGLVPWGPDNSANGIAGVKTFTTNVFLTQSVLFTPSSPGASSGGVASFESGLLEVQVLGPNNERLDSTKIALSSRFARLDNSSPSTATVHDFLQNSGEASSINTHYHQYPTGAAISFGDPRYRPTPITTRWYTVTRSDSPRLSTSLNQAEMDPRAYAIDWCDYIGNRPLLFHRDGPMLSIGELGNVAACEYPWRTLYLQYAGRAESTKDANAIPEIQDRRGSSSAAQTNPALLPQDYVLTDLFKTSSVNTRSGAVNINSQYYVPNTASVDQGVFVGLLSGISVGGGMSDTIAATSLSASASGLISYALAQRRSAFAPAASGVPGTTGNPPIDNSPRRPYFLFGECASDISRLINFSTGGNTVTTSPPSRARTSVLYSVLRPTPTTINPYNRNQGTDMQAEEPFRKISNAITTRGNVFRVLYVGQAIKDINKSKTVDSQAEVQSEYLGEAFVERRSIFGTPSPSASPVPPANPDIQATNDSTYIVLANRVITE